jgi:hypothetical protein
MTVMTATTGFPLRKTPDRNAFLIFVGLVWIGVLSGFGTDSFAHVSKHGLDYPLVVHFHAVAFVSWLALFTVQTGLIRAGNSALHRKLGLAGAVLAGVMLVLGPVTALIVDGARYAATGATPEFTAVQFCDMIGFGLLTGAGLLARGTSAAHKRLMLLGLFFISDAGFARFLNGFVAPALGKTLTAEWVGLYLGSTLLAVGLGVYDLITRRKLHPAYLGGMAVTFVLQAIAMTGLHSEAWKALSIKLIGH